MVEMGWSSREREVSKELEGGSTLCLQRQYGLLPGGRTEVGENS